MKLRDWIPSMLIVLLIVLALVAIGRCATNPKKSNTTCWLPEGCVTQFTENPYTYKVGALTNASIIGDNEGVVVRIQPLATYSLFTEDLLLCGVPADMFLNKGNPLVLTYKTKASKTVQGIGCHELVRVDEMKTETPQK
jgi:hypothetical protein